MSTRSKAAGAAGEDPRAASRARMVEGIIRAVGELVLTQKNADIPSWVDSDLTVSQLRAIYLLAHHGPLGIGELAGLLKIGNPATSILVQQLVQRNLVERLENPRDRRRTFARLTERGYSLVRDRVERREAQFLPRLNRLSDEELSGLLRGLEALLAVMRADQAAAGGAARGAVQDHRPPAGDHIKWFKRKLGNSDSPSDKP